ncbi:MAG: phage baseplate assembly protein V [Planktomarina sp.]
MSDFDFAELMRRQANMISVGVVTQIDPGTSRAKVRIGDMHTPLIKVGSLRAGKYTLLWMPSVGEQVVVFAPSGDFAQSFIAHALPTDDMPSHAAQPHLDLRGDQLVINGDVIVKGDVIAGGVSLQNHVHKGVTPGKLETKEPVK